MSELKVEMLKHGQVSYRKSGHGARKILFFHGFPGSSLQIQIFDNWVQSRDLEVLCFDRPGYHQTARSSKGHLDDTAKIAAELMGKLDWVTCEVFAVSGGAPSGLCFSAQYPERVSRTHIVSGMVPLRLLQLHRHFSPASLVALRLLPHIPGAVIEKFFGVKSKHLSPKSQKTMQYFLPGSKADEEILLRTEVEEVLRVSLVEALRQRGAGPKMDARLFLAPWHQRLASFAGPVNFWHGEEDRIIRHQAVKEFAATLQNASVDLVLKQGHFSLPIEHMGQILNR